eukprot:TRINITY_DN969_c0_g1_i1.p1 TRINITY_DN969_c0_g1~~TRINITY_DN969_c0_g1_i1.p1  ORF type:complete len:330 (-),score=53.04 TRINITY_DN969_c0_g1_i1:44-988(-)
MKVLWVVCCVVMAVVAYCAAEQQVVDNGVPVLERTEGDLTLIPTPFGWRPKQCVHRDVGNDVVIRSVVDEQGLEYAVEIEDKAGQVKSLPILPECVAWDKKMQIERAARRMNGTVNNLQDGWLDNAGYYPPSLVGSFDGDYVVPRSPASEGSQILFYFIGATNFKGGSGETILQPVLQWNNGIRGWSFASWNCCPGGQTHEATPFVGFGPGAVIYGGIDQSGSNWKILSSWGSKRSTLDVANAGRDFDWVDATLETYGVKSCPEFASGDMKFYNMRLKLSNGQGNTPSWKTTAPTQCNGHITVQNPSSIVISHN